MNRSTVNFLAVYIETDLAVLTEHLHSPHDNLTVAILEQIELLLFSLLRQKAIPTYCPASFPI